MKIYIVVAGWKYGASHVPLGVFSTLAKACEAVVKAVGTVRYDGYQIDEYEVDAEWTFRWTYDRDGVLAFKTEPLGKMEDKPL